MMRRLGFAIAVILSLSVAGSAVGQEPYVSAVSHSGNDLPDMSHPWTLRQCIDYALDNNIDIKRQELSVKDAELSKAQSRLDYIPSVSAGGGYSLSVGRVLDQTTYQFLENSTNSGLNGSLSAGTELFAGLRKYHTLKRADLNLQSVIRQVEKTRNDLSLNITAAYLDILFAEEKVSIADRRIEVLGLQVEQATKQVEAGRKTVGDLLQLQAELSDAKYQAVDADNSRTLAYFNLGQLLEINDFQNLHIFIPKDMQLNASMVSQGPDEIIEMAQSLPEISIAQIGIDMADRNIKIAKAVLYPSLSVSAGYGSSYSDGRMKPDMTDPSTYIRYPFKEQIKDNASFSVSLSLSIPIFSSFTARNGVRSSRIAGERAQYDYMVAQKTLSREIRQAYLDAVGAYEQYDAALKSLQTNEESFRMVEQKYNLGAVSAVDYSIALFNLVSARSQIAQTKYSYIFKTKILDFYKGVPIEL